TKRKAHLPEMCLRELRQHALINPFSRNTASYCSRPRLRSHPPISMMGLPHKADDNLRQWAYPVICCQRFAFFSATSITWLKRRLLFSDSLVSVAIAEAFKRCGLTRSPMRHARVVLEELVLHVQPPKGCAVVLTERPSINPAIQIGLPRLLQWGRLRRR